MEIRKKSVLFVDDDPLIVRGYRRSAEELAEDWDLFFATSGEQALELLGQHAVDLIVTDMRMPMMNGIELLEKVRQRFPSVVRFILSANTESEKSLLAARLAHQFIAKPCDMQFLWNSIKRSCQLREMFSDPYLLKNITSIVDLPSMPTLYLILIKEMESPEPSLKKIGDVISQDISMTAKILQMVNSAFFGIRGKISNPQQAVNILGINTIKALVINIHVFSQFERFSNPFFSLDKLWNHSLLVGGLARSIASNMSLDAQKLQDAQVAGMLHDIGKLIQLKIPDFFNRVDISDGSVSLESEYRVFRVSHAEIGAYMLGLWGLPDNVVEAIAFHHQPQKIIAKDFNIASAVHIANGMAIMPKGLEINKLGKFLDLSYLEKIQAISHLEEWIELANNLSQK